MIYLMRLFVSVILISLVTCQNRHLVEGVAVETPYRIVLESRKWGAAAQVRTLARQELQKIAGHFSLYSETSEISRFNRHQGNFPASGPFLELTSLSLDLARRSDGALDPTIGPLLVIWGFGPQKPDRAPELPEIRKTQEQIGYRKIEIQGQTIVKKEAQITLNLNALLDGYAAQKLADSLTRAGYHDFMVEIGGEIVVRRKEKQEPWKIGIEKPQHELEDHVLHRTIYLHSAAVATSGDYRNFIKYGEKRISHILDPRTGQPARTSAVSATVVGPDCALADGLATALLVLSPDDALALIEKTPGYEALLLLGESGGRLEERMTGGMERYFEPPPAELR